MSQDLNTITIIGRLTRDAELQYTNNSTALCKMSIAVNRSVKKGDQWQDEANFFDVTLWGKRAEALNVYLAKGQQVAIKGELKQDRWEQDGVKRSRVTIEASSIQLLGGKPQGNSRPQESAHPGKTYTPPEPQDNQAFEDDLIPF